MEYKKGSIVENTKKGFTGMGYVVVNVPYKTFNVSTNRKLFFRRYCQQLHLPKQQGSTDLIFY